MKLLILPSNRILYHHGKVLFTLLPESHLAEQYTALVSNSKSKGKQQPDLIATLHYKTINVYKIDDIKGIAQRIEGNTYSPQKEKLKPILSETLAKRVEVLDLYRTQNVNQKEQRLLPECVISDKFGDMYKVKIDFDSIQNKKQHALQAPIYINSNLGIPKYVKYLSLKNTNNQYLILADEQNRVKIYNLQNPHQIISVWFMINMFSIECQILNVREDQQIVVMLFKYFNKITLEEDVRLYYFEANESNIRKEEFPGVQIKSPKSINLKECKFYTTLALANGQAHALLMIYLFENRIIYELYTVQQGSNALLLKSTNEIKIEQGKWDYLYGFDAGDNKNVVVAYGSDVEMPAKIEAQQNQSFNMGDNPNISLNKYEKLLRFQVIL